MSQYIKSQSYLLFETFCRKNQVDGKTISIKVGSNPLDVKVASTPRSQAQGYMGARVAPNDGEGILFVYDEPQPLSFWMKNVPFDLDIIFFDSNLKYLGHETMSKHGGEEDHSIPRYSSKKPARFAVEVKSGWCKEKGIDSSCSLEI